MWGGYLSGWSRTSWLKLTLVVLLALVNLTWYIQSRFAIFDVVFLPLSTYNATSTVSSSALSLFQGILPVVLLNASLSNFSVSNSSAITSMPRVTELVTATSTVTFSPTVPGRPSPTFPEEKITNPHYPSILRFPNVNCSNRTIELVICVTISHDNVRGRDVVRQTWGSYAQNHSHNALLVFFIGSPSPNTSQVNITMESENYRDILQEDYIDSYHNLSLKSVSVLRWVSTFCPQAQFLVKVDDDIFLNVPLLVTTLRQHAAQNPASKAFIIGSLQQGAVPIRDPSSKWYAPVSMFSGKRYPDYVSGTAYAMTGVAAYLLFEASLRTPLFWLEDIYITGLCAKKASVEVRNSSYFTLGKPHASGCIFRTMISGHRYSLEEIMKIYRESQDPSLKC